MLRLPIQVSDALEVRLGPIAITLTPGQGFRVAEDIIRKSARRVLSEEADRDRVPAARTLRRKSKAAR